MVVEEVRVRVRVQAQVQAQVRVQEQARAQLGEEVAGVVVVVAVESAPAQE